MSHRNASWTRKPLKSGFLNVSSGSFASSSLVALVHKISSSVAGSLVETSLRVWFTRVGIRLVRSGISVGMFCVVSWHCLE
ncbi:hypothetical protein K440DRAFT_625438 [Wilcoxina mikolae CBS 423.85]|nr:hypothetical protein K440DRAFT_625438 [Wilcoxina mikolae CBS 423.85]